MNVKVYQATIEQFKELWEYSNTSTYKYFLKGITDDVIEFWTMEVNNQLIAELYIFWDSVDKDEANGTNRAYLCAFRVQKEYQGLGYGSLLMNRGIDRVKENEFTEITIGIDNREYQKLKSMYEKFGFNEMLKSTQIDNHYLDESGHPVKYNEEYQIYISRIVKVKNE